MKFKEFQKLDLARLALVDGAILAWDTGLGKTWAMFTWPLLKCGWTVGPGGSITPAKPVLLLVPGDLHDKTVDAGRDIFRTTVQRLETQADFERLSPAGQDLKPGFYITSYHQLGVNGVAAFPELGKDSLESVMAALSIRPLDILQFFDQRGTHLAGSYELLGATPADTEAGLYQRHKTAAEETPWQKKELEKALYTLLPFHCDKPHPNFADLSASKRREVSTLYTRTVLSECATGIGDTRTAPSSSHPSSALGSPSSGHHPIKCVYSPTLADLCTDRFDTIVIDEGVRIKGEHTLIGRAARQLRTRRSLILSATPIKNRLPDIFRLAWLAAGGQSEPTARFPYADSEDDLNDFAETFCVSERNLTKEEDTDRRWVKLTPQVCNVHQVWKLFGPLILRRRKKDIGEQLVRKIKRIIRVPMGTEQAKVYRYHMAAEYLDCNRREAIGARLQALRAAAASPNTGLEPKPLPRSETDPLPHISGYSYTPKMAAALRLIAQAMQRREQIVLFSSLHGPLDTLSARLIAAGVRHLKLDGRMSQARRGKASAQFRLGPPSGAGPASLNLIPVMLAGGECMAEGHDWPKANNVVQVAYSWAFDKVAQAIDRVYRLNSERDVNYWPIITDGTIERRMESMQDDKSDASELVLDGHLLGETPDEMNLAELLRVAAAELGEAGATIDEASLEPEWKDLREELRLAQRIWDYGAAAAPIRLLPDPEPVQSPAPPQNIVTLPSVPLVPSVPSPVTPWRAHLLRRSHGTLTLV